MTKQEIIDKQWDWFIVQDKPFGMNATGSCMYRGDDGSPCSVGLLIPDEKYRREMENTGPRNIGDELGWDPETIDFIIRIQTIHDSASRFVGGYQKHKFAERLRALAVEYDLTLPEGDPS